MPKEECDNFYAHITCVIAGGGRKEKAKITTGRRGKTSRCWGTKRNLMREKGEQLEKEQVHSPPLCLPQAPPKTRGSFCSTLQNIGQPCHICIHWINTDADYVNRQSCQHRVQNIWQQTSDDCRWPLARLEDVRPQKTHICFFPSFFSINLVSFSSFLSFPFSLLSCLLLSSSCVQLHLCWWHQPKKPEVPTHSLSTGKKYKFVGAFIDILIESGFCFCSHFKFFFRSTFASVH